MRSIETPYELKVRYHSLWLMAAIAYPLWALVADWTGTESTSRLREFLWASPIFLAALLFSKLANPRVKTMRGLHVGLTFSLTLHYFLLLKLNGLAISAVIGLFILVFSVAATFATRRALLCYSLFVVALSLTLITATGPTPPSIVICGLLMALAISFVGVWDRLNAINRLREIQRKLETANRSIEGILNSVQDGFATLDRDFKFTYMNPAGAKATRREAAYFIGKSIYELENDFKSGPMVAALESVKKDRRSVEIEFFNGDFATGSWWQSRIHPAENEGYSLVFRDVTETKRIQRTLKEQEAKSLMSAKMSTLGEMASGIAHEINNPLAIIYAKAELLGNSVKSGRLTNEMVTTASVKICDTVMRIGRIVKGLRAFARDGDQDPFENVLAKNLLSDVLELCSQRFVASEVELRLSDLRPILSIECRPVQISQILLNLLNNAFDSVNALSGHRWVEVNCTDTDDNFEVRITDSGTLIEPWVRAKLFQPFFTTKDPNRGTGLGLSIARGIAESHGGRLEFDATAVNTCFVLTLPKRQTVRHTNVA